ncbi:MAG: ParB/RepB/Spo0J family partition protein [Clostridia bacterium]
MAKMTGLGKGLDALFSVNNVEPVKEEIQEGEVIQSLKLIDVEPNRNQPRQQFDTEKIDELAESIKEYGVIQPIIVTKEDDHYKIVAGERRWRAAKKAGISEIPAIVRVYTEQTNKEIALIENIQREDLNPIEKAVAMKELLEKYQLTQQQLSDKLGISRSGIANTIRVLNLDERVINLVLDGKLTEGHCRTLLRIEDPDKQYETAKYMVESGDSVREAEKQIELKQQKKKTVKKTTNTRYNALYRDIEDSFRSFFGSKVKINAGKRSGKIIIEYNSNEELARLLEIVK